MSLPLEIIVKGNEYPAVAALQKTQQELGKTAIAAQKTDSSLQKLSSSGGQSIFNLTEKLRVLQSNVFTEKDRGKIALYNAEIRATEGEMAKLQNLGSSSLGAIGQGATKALSALRTLSYILPGIGVAGIVAFATGPIIKFVESLFAATDAEKKLAEQAKIISDLTEETSKNYGKEITSLQILRGAIESTTLPMATRLQAIKDLKKEFPGLFTGLTNEELLTGKVGAAYDLAAAAILRKARATAAATQLENIETQKIAISLEKDQADAEKTLLDIQKAKDIRSRAIGINATGEERVNTAQAQRDFLKAARTERLKANQQEIDDLNNQQAFLLKIAIEGADQTIKIEEEKHKKIKKIREKALKDFRNYIISDQGLFDVSDLKFEPKIIIKPKFEFFESANFTKEMKAAAEAQTAIVQGIFTDAFIGIGDAIGNAIATKGNFFGGIFAAMFKALGAGVRQLGVYAVATSKAIIAIKTYLGTSLGIAGGVALIALGTLISAAANKIKAPQFATGTRNFQGGSAIVGERGPERIFLPAGSSVQPNNELNAFGGGGQVFIPAITLSGSDLVIAFNRASQQMNRNN